MAVIKVSTQAELEAALQKQAYDIELTGSGLYVIKEGSPALLARESSAPSIVAWGSSAPRIEAWGSSAPSIVARESSAPSIVAWGSSAPIGSVGSFAGLILALHDKAKSAITGTGNNILQLPKVEIKTAVDWCAYYGVPVTNGTAVLYKAVNDDFSSKWRSNTLPNGVSYAPGSKPEAPDWDGGKAECGGGLHFSPSPSSALMFHAGAQRFVACPVAIDDIVVHKDPEYPAKIKARAVCAAIYEVDLNGDPVKENTNAVPRPRRSKKQRGTS
jgi:hypothetical protein